MKPNEILSHLRAEAPEEMAALTAALKGTALCGECGGTGVCGDEGPGMRNAVHEWLPCGCPMGDLHRATPKPAMEFLDPHTRKPQPDLSQTGVLFIGDMKPEPVKLLNTYRDKADQRRRAESTTGELLDALKGLLAAEMLNETALSFGDASAMDAANEAKWPAVDAAKAAIARAEGREP